MYSTEGVLPLGPVGVGTTGLTWKVTSSSGLQLLRGRVRGVTTLDQEMRSGAKGREP